MFKSILGLFLKYVFWLLKISFNFILFFILDIPVAILTIPRWTHYRGWVVEFYWGILTQLGYWAARYLTAEDWVYDGYNAPEFENHYYQWRFFLLVRHYWKFALSITFKIILGWIISIIHFFVWWIYRLFNYRVRYYKKVCRHLEFVWWKIMYAYGVRINLSINNSLKLSAFHPDFKYFDRKGWYTYGRDYILIIPEMMRHDYIPEKFRIKKEVNELISDEKRGALKKNLTELKVQLNFQFPKSDLVSYLRNYEGDSRILGSEKIVYDFFSKLQESAERDLLSSQERLLKKGTRVSITTKDGKERELSLEDKEALLKKISLAKTKAAYAKLIYELSSSNFLNVEAKAEKPYDTQISANANEVLNDNAVQKSSLNTK